MASDSRDRTGDENPRSRERLGRWLPGLAALTLVTRGVLALRTAVLSTDSEGFLWMAADWRAGSLSAVLENPVGYSPLYPVLVGETSRLTGGDLALAGYGVSILFSTLLVLPLATFTRKLLGDSAALGAVFLYAVHPLWLETGTDCMTESLFATCFLGSVTLLTRSPARRSELALPRVAAAGLLGCLAYLTRVEGIYLPLYTAGLCGLEILAGLRRGEGARIGGALARLGVFLLVFLAGSAPFLLEIREIGGRWDYSLKAAVARAQRREAAKPAREEARAPDTSRGVDNKWVKWRREHGDLGAASIGFLRYFHRSASTLHPLWIVVGLVLLVRRRGRERKRPFPWPCLYWSVGFFGPIFVLLYLGRNDADARYFLGGWLFLFPVGGYGLAATLGTLRGERSRVPAPWRTVLIVILLGLTSTMALLEFRKVRREDQLLIRVAGERIRELEAGNPPPEIVASRRKFVYYAGGRHWPHPGDSRYEFLLRAARARGARYILGFEKDFARARPPWPESVDPAVLERIPLENPDPDRHDSVVIYRVVSTD